MVSLIRTAIMLAVVLLSALPVRSVWAQQRRARPPQYPPDAFRGVFFEDVTQALRGERPRSDERAASAATAPARIDDAESRNAPAGGDAADSAGRWRSLAAPVHLEDEVKRLKLQYDALVTTPGRFKSGGFREARSKLSTLAVLMGVIAEYEGTVRFQQDAAVARDLLARAAVNVAAGTNEAFNEANQRKADLQDLISGTGLDRSESDGPVDWSLVGARLPLMEYLDDLLNNTLQAGSVDAAAVAAAEEELQRSAAMVAVIAEVLKQEGMEDAEDADYRQMASAMQRAAMEVRQAVEENDPDAARRAVGTLGQSCNACHQQYQ